jgi:hypothetical protein
VWFELAEIEEPNEGSMMIWDNSPVRASEPRIRPSCSPQGKRNHIRRHLSGAFQQPGSTTVGLKPIGNIPPGEAEAN